MPQDQLRQTQVAIEDARVGFDAADKALQKAHQYLKNLPAGKALPTEPHAQAELMKQVQQAIDAVGKDLQKLSELQLRLSQYLYRLSG